ncbi:MAG: type II toxin-antitoxin system VapC family toxin [Wenzhouxiangella sp.]|nr:MAG: type II toxin-antitoxin system VapC family toxin [Wenzhouxiangella sp.]
MIAIDTNVLVRLVTNDEPNQAARAARLFGRQDVFMAKTVLLESEWVLRYAYGLSRETIAKALRGALGLPRVTVEDADAVALALEHFEAGLDFADALHWASSRRADRFVTFDKKLIRRAAGLGDPLVGSP